MVWTSTDQKEPQFNHHGDHKETNGRLQLQMSLVKKKIDFLRLQPSTTSPKTNTLGKQKKEEKGTRDTPILFSGQSQVTQEETPLSLTAQKGYSRF